MEEAESVVSQLKDKDSQNKEQIAIIEKYDISQKEFSSVEKCVSSLYQQKTTKTQKNNASTNKARTTGKNSVLRGKNSPTSKVEISVGLINPTSGVITSRFGIRSRNYHTGIDIGAPRGTSIKAAASGTVTFAGYDGAYGNKIVVSHGSGVETVYAHCTKLLFSAGSSVSQGTCIATVGSTGRSTGNHLHFEVRVNGVAQNPQNYVY
ncbi:MAG: M23 family metallopeptidase [Clostridia bacterium]|nr:M23 family metallopeptidase [Clostridia bacterium]